ncbi:PLP-dependent aminotransferase family protein [Tundrisphaera lichenicola]|uniref:aminotransferase-like domain-containing protein n=1 Tax=Tundrisphaera lichenicola TaxID=2029860 RepID=UPI003EB88191
MQTALANPGLISLAAGFVDQQSLPHEITARVLAEILGDPVEGRRALQYGTTVGDLTLRRECVSLLERNERVAPGTFEGLESRVVITTGSAQLLYLVSEALLDPGDIVLVEAPTYFVFLGVLETRGVRAMGIGIDEGGMKLDDLEATLAGLEARGELDRVKLIYTVTEHSNPSGISLADDRRGALVELARRWSKRTRIHVLEDAAYRGLNYEGDEPTSVWRHDPEGETVILGRTFSKTFSPGIKLGFGVLPAHLVEPVVSLKGNHDFGTTNLTQQIMSRVLADGSYERHIAGLIAMYRRKRDVMLGALDEQFAPLDGSVTWTRPKGGMFVWLSAPEGVDLGTKGPVLAKCLEEGVLYIPGSFAFPGEPGPVPTHYARICFGVPSESDLTEGVRRLAVALAACMDPVA